MRACLFRLSAVCAVIAGTIVGLGAAPASAGQLCEQVAAEGTWVAPTSYTYCRPYAGTFCEGQGEAVASYAGAWVYVCVPDPVSAP
ncbi:MAG: hypothetical protein QOD07_2391 [Frankiaceae bacterium]|jgi:hypothetical protein|nr:hypothetical protein [Frankiaceae bacterium]